VGVVGVLALVPGTARASGSATINTTLVFPYTQLPSSAPFKGNFSGTFSASGTVSDTGTLTAQTVLGAVASPVAATNHTVRTYSSSGGNGTLTLRCNDRFSPPGQPTTAPVSLAGSCVVLDATGAYAGLKGSGSLTGITEFGATAITIQDTVTLGG
jgi:hypothetical protein